MKIIYAILISVFLVSGCVQTSYEQDISEVQRLAIQGNPSAQANLGYAYQYGVGLEKNPQQAFNWNLKAANLEDPYGQHNLAVMYDEGVDIPQNKSKAVTWYRKAAEQGLIRAQFNLGVMFWKGDGVDKDYEQAWNLLNHVRFTSSDKKIKWRARWVLGEIKKEIGVDKSMSRFSYPEWDVVQQKKSRKK